MSVITSEHTARKLYECARCGLDIQPGERYRRHALTPRDSDIGNDAWWTQREHIDCNECDDPETRGAAGKQRPQGQENPKTGAST